MKPYQAYRSTDIAWLQEIPAHWSIQLFRRLATEVIRKNDDGEARPMLSLSAYRGVELKEWASEEQARLKEDSLNYKIVEPGQLVINPMWCIYGAVAVSILHGIVSPAYRVYKLGGQLRPKYADYLLRSHFYVKEYNLHVRGSTTYDRSVRKDAFNQLPILLPPLDEQDAITTFLETKEREIRRFIANKHRMIELLKEQRSSFIGRIATQGMNPNVTLKPSGIPWLGNMPEHWIKGKLAWVCSSIRDGTHNPPPEFNGNYRLLSVRNIINGELVLREDDRRMSEESYQELQRSYTVKKDDVVLAIVGGTTGKSAVVGQLENISVQRSLAILRPDKSKIRPAFLNLCLQLPATQRTI